MSFWRPSMELDDWAFRRPRALDLAVGEAPPVVGELIWLGADPLGAPILLRVEGVQGSTVWFVRLPEEDWPESLLSVGAWRLRGPSATRVIARQ